MKKNYNKPVLSISHFEPDESIAGNGNMLTASLCRWDNNTGGQTDPTCQLL
jgi:hypothetical protein